MWYTHFEVRQMLETITDIDFYILDFLQVMARSSFWDGFFAYYTNLGNAVMVICYCALLLCFRQTRKDGIMVSCGALSGVLICNLILKNIIQRSRPCWLRPEVQLLIPSPKDYSFPSGHAASVTILTVILVHNHPRLAIGLIPAALLMVYSRMYLYVHFPSDVLAGMIIGGAIGLLVCFLSPKVEEKWKKKHSIS